VPTDLPAESPDRPDTLARLPKGRHGLPREFVAQNQRGRLIAALVSLVGERGIDGVTIASLVDVASVSSSTFYKHFRSVDECYAAAFEQALVELGETVRAAFEAEAEWPLQVRAALAAWLGHLAGDPAVARLLTAEPFVAGPAIADLHRRAIEIASPYLARGREQRPSDAEPLPQSTERGLLGALNSAISRQVKADRSAHLRELLPDLVQFSLTPYLGSSEAHRIAGIP
jgi:AcrR family transcriptional regulator